MLNGVWEKIKNGSDIRGIATSADPRIKIDLSNEVIEKICQAFAVWISKKTELTYSDLTIAIGHDSRLSSMRIKNVVINTLRHCGITVYDCSLTSTPAMFMAVSVLQCTASIQITASHQPSDRNGMKFFTAKGGLTSKDIEDLLKIAQDGNRILSKTNGKVRTVNLMSYYCEKLRKLIKSEINSEIDYDKPLDNTKIVVDAGNGAGGFFVEEILKPLGADTSGSVGLNPDGNFPLHVPNPENKEAMEYISKVTLESKADIGIIFDTDVDRAAIVDSSGKEISQTRLVALVSAMVLKAYPHSVIVTDSVTTESLKNFIDKLGGYQFRYKRGYRNVIRMAQKINQNGGICALAIESSGHAAFRDNDFIDDGAYLACKIIIEMVLLRRQEKELFDLIKNLDMPVNEAHMRFPLLENFESNDTNKILKDLESYSKSSKMVELDSDNVEGTRIHFPAKHQKGWLLLRKSLHDPVLTLYAESYVIGGLKSILDFTKQFLKKYNFLDISELEKK